jgi:hypothetical protein
MGNYQISTNQLVNFYNSTENGKKRIIAQQLVPDPFRISLYQLTKARIKKSIALKGDLEPVYDGIKTLMARTPKSTRQETNKRVSIEALERFVIMRLPKVLQSVDYSIVKTNSKFVPFAGIDIIVAPEIVVTAEIGGKKVVGGIKIHISKSKPFDIKESKISASTVFLFLQNEFASKGYEVLPELSFCLDVFAGRIVSAPIIGDPIYKELESICEEIVRLYKAA